MGTKTHNNYEDLITFTRASAGHALRPVSYGTELITSGTFDDSSALDDWTTTGNVTASVSNGEVTISGDGGYNDGLQQVFNTTVGAVYSVTVTGRSITGNVTMRVRELGGTYTTIAEKTFTSTSNETVTLSFTAISSQSYVQLMQWAGSAGSGVFDNVSIKEVTFDQPDGTLTLFEHPESVPRVEWDSAGRLGLLVEESRTNVVTYSEDLSQGTAVNNPTITTNIATAPDGTETVDGIQDTSGGNFKRVKLFSGAVSANSTYTGSLFVKKESVETNYGGIVLSFTAGTSNSTCYGIIDAVNGTISPATANNITATFTVTDVGDFWRFSITGTDTGSNTQLEFGVYGTLSVDGSTTGTGEGSVRRVWGAQLEAGSFPTSYIKSNSGSTTTRSADVASVPVADFGYN